jgi:acyl carrier protein
MPPSSLPALVSALAEQCVAPLTNMVKKVAQPLGASFLTSLLRPAEPAATDRDSTSATAGTVHHDTPLTDPTLSSRPRRKDATESLLEHCAALLGMPVSDIDERRPLRELGLDSLMASQLRQRLRRHHGVEIPVGRLLGAESLADLRESLARNGVRAGHRNHDEPRHSA